MPRGNADILTLFPEMFDGFINTSIIKRAIENNKPYTSLEDFYNSSYLIVFASLLHLQLTIARNKYSIFRNPGGI